jgi:hypothetical protein
MGNRYGDEIHAFELAGLGKAPFAFKGTEEKLFRPTPDSPAKPGGTCQFCSTGITTCYHLESADGKRFYVGSSCINKAGGNGLRSATKNAINHEKNKKRWAREEKKIAEGQTIIDHPKFRAHFSALPHPWADQEKRPYGPDYSEQTALDGINQYWNICGNSGKCKNLKHLKEQAIEAGVVTS